MRDACTVGLLDNLLSYSFNKLYSFPLCTHGPIGGNFVPYRSTLQPLIVVLAVFVIYCRGDIVEFFSRYNISNPLHGAA